MIVGTHALIYADDAEAARAFFRDVLGFAHVDDGGGWLIFQLPPAEVGVHPSGTGMYTGGKHELYLMCDDIERTVHDLTAKGVVFSGEITEEPWGRLISIQVPGAGEFGLYQPLHKTAYDLEQTERV